MSPLTCASEQRREAVRQHARLNGLDYLEVGADRRTLSVHFLGKAPVSLEPANVVIEGGRRRRGIKVERVTVRRTEMPGLDDTMEVVTDREGDASPYVLRVVLRDEQGVDRPHPAFDPRYDRVTFTFKADCPSDLDCKQERRCPPEPRDEPEINYLAKDYASFRQLMLDRLALVMPEWRERHVPDLGIAIVEILAYAGDHLSYYQDAVATEAYIGTARQRISVRRHARLVDYALHEGCNARTWVCLQTDGALILEPADIWFITKVPDLGPVVRQGDLLQLALGRYEVFQPTTDRQIKLYPGQHQIRFYTWGDQECCLSRGSTTATLIGRWIEEPVPSEPPCDPPKGEPAAKPAATPAQAPATGASGPELHLEPGDVLIFEEVIGPGTGAPADADPARRHPVRLTRVAHVQDPLDPDRALTEITWAEEDALPFPLCLSAMGPAPSCEVIQDISVACGNLVLVDHGRPVVEELDPVPIETIVEACGCDGTAKDTELVAGRFRPILKGVPPTFRDRPVSEVSAARMLRQNPRQALPQVVLTTTDSAGAPARWLPQRDLLASQNPDRHFVVEIDDDGRAHLRFGDDEMGQRPEAAAVFTAAYRVGNGPDGNVGSDAVAHLATGQHSVSGGVVSVRNPLPATGGTAAEPVREAKLYAPHAFRQRLERAITADDYAAIVRREFPTKVQRAAASLRWNGSWHEVLVVVDVFGQEQADSALLAEITSKLQRYRRIGHDLRVAPARLVPLDVEMRVCVLEGFLRAHVKQALLDVFGNRLYGDGRLGYFHPDRLSFGDGIFLSALVATAQAVAGVESVSVTRLQRLFEPANGEIDSGVLPLGPLEIARLDNDPAVPDNGQLRFDMRGGR
jgi:hypothetical protein